MPSVFTDVLAKLFRFLLVFQCPVLGILPNKERTVEMYVATYISLDC